MNVQETHQLFTQKPEIARQAHDEVQRLLARSASDWEFRTRLLSDPRSAVAEFTGRELPESWNVQFVENKAAVTLVLPDPVDPAAELSDAELESVAGGGTPLVVAIMVLAAEVVCVGVAAAMSD